MEKFIHIETIINNETGEIVSQSEKKVNGVKEQLQRKENHERDLKTKEFQDYQKKTCGCFIFLILDHISELEGVLNDSNLCRYIYMASFAKSGNITPFTKEKLFNQLKCSKRTFSDFYKTIIENKLIFLDENNIIHINSSAIFKGKEKQYKKITGIGFTNFIRLYIQSIRQLYEENYKSIKKVAIVYKIMPYINYEHNIVCSNPEETELSKVKPLMIKEIMKLFGYSLKFPKRFEEDFFNISFQNHIVFLIENCNLEVLSSVIICNPLVAYRGKNIQKLIELQNRFKSFEAFRKRTH